MAEITKQAIYELAKQILADTSSLVVGVEEVRGELHALRWHIRAIQRDIQNIRFMLARQEMRLEQIDTRLGLVEPDAA